MRRYDVYGFRDASLEAAAQVVEEALGIKLSLRDSSYVGLYYVAGAGAAKDYVVETNAPETGSWYREFPDYETILMVNALPDMDTIRDKLTRGRAEPVLLRTTSLPDEPDDDDDDDAAPE